MRELLFLHHLVIFLKLSVMPEAQQEARSIMHFNLHSFIRGKLDVVIARLFMRRDRADKGDNPFISTFHPDVNIARRTGIRIRIHQCIPLPFQDTGSESFLLEPVRDFYSSIIKLGINLLKHSASPHPFIKQFLAYPTISWQSLYAIKENSQ